MILIALIFFKKIKNFKAHHDPADCKHDEFQFKNCFISDEVINLKKFPDLIKQFFLIVPNCLQSLEKCLRAVILSETFNSILINPKTLLR
jgi:hypothetical protein